jgi:hypothetical protein
MRVSDQLYALAALHPILLHRRLGGLHSRSARCGGEKNLSLLPRIKPRYLDRHAHSLITVLTGVKYSVQLSVETQAILTEFFFLWIY